MFKNIKAVALLMLGSSLAFTSCKKDDDVVQTIVEGTDMELPTSYDFDSRFTEGISSVAYPGQVARNLLVNDINKLIESAATTSNTSLKSDILNLYDYSDNATNILTTAGSFSLTQSVYEDLSTGKNLSGKINTTETVFGYTKSADQLITDWIDSLDVNINTNSYTGEDIYISADSVDLKQMINKVLLGSVVYYQGADVYLDRIATDDNTVAKSEGAAYTQAEHTWDEGFGYFGAARNYFDYTDAELKSTPYGDDDADSKIDFNSEYNFGFSVNAAKRDLITTTTNVDPMFTTDCFNAFLAGRTALANQRDTTEIKFFAERATQTWEKVIAATVIHYINETITDLGTRLSTSSESYDKYDLYKHWSEMRGFTVALQYGASNFQLVNDADLATIATTMGNSLADILEGGDTEINDYIEELESIALTLRLTYNFDSSNTANWKKGK